MHQPSAAYGLYDIVERHNKFVSRLCQPQVLANVHWTNWVGGDSQWNWLGQLSGFVKQWYLNQTIRRLSQPN